MLSYAHLSFSVWLKTKHQRNELWRDSRLCVAGLAMTSFLSSRGLLGGQQPLTDVIESSGNYWLQQQRLVQCAKNNEQTNIPASWHRTALWKWSHSKCNVAVYMRTIAALISCCNIGLPYQADLHCNVQCTKPELHGSQSVLCKTKPKTNKFSWQQTVRR